MHLKNPIVYNDKLYFSDFGNSIYRIDAPIFNTLTPEGSLDNTYTNGLVGASIL